MVQVKNLMELERVELLGCDCCLELVLVLVLLGF